VNELKVLIGCDGVNSVVAKWLGLKKPTSTGRFAIRGCVDFKHNHGFAPKSMQFFGNGVRFGFVPCDDDTVYWFFTWIPTSQGESFPSTYKSMFAFLFFIFFKKVFVVTNTNEKKKNNVVWNMFLSRLH
jgi:hypothetical protein